MLNYSCIPETELLRVWGDENTAVELGACHTHIVGPDNTSHSNPRANTLKTPTRTL